MGAKKKAKSDTHTQGSTVNPDEIANFERMAEEWWDPAGKFKPLHDMNPTRISYIREALCQHFGKDSDAMKPLEGITLVDIGCGGGLITEPMARMGAAASGVDASEKNIGIASTHAAQTNTPINYRASTAEALAEDGEQYDVVLALEIVEHVADVDLFIQACAALVKPGGLLFLSTINRTGKSLVMAKFGAEYVLRLLPRGTHHWRKFLKPSELHHHCRTHGLDVAHTTGMVLNPLKWEWSLKESDLDVNYMLMAKKPS